jgi:hypothetical protein
MRSSELSAAGSARVFAFPLRKLVAAAVIIFVVLVPLSHGFRVPAVPMDEGSLLVYPERILKGDLPYRDFETFYGPANLWVLASAYGLFGAGIFAERSVGLIYRLLILVAVFVLAQRRGSLLAAGCTAIAGFLLICTWLAAYAWIGAIACGLWSVWVAGRTDSESRCFFGGLLAGCALLFRIDLGVAVIASGVPLFWAMNLRGKMNYISGACIGLLPLFAIAVAAGPHNVLNNLFVFPVLYSSPARHLPISSARNFVVYLLLAHAAASLVNLVAGVIALRGKWPKEDARIFLAAALFGIGLTHQVAQRMDPLHILFAALVSLPLLPLGLDVFISRGRAALVNRASAWAAFGVLVILGSIVPKFTAIVWQELTSAIGLTRKDAFFLERNGRTFPFPDPALELQAGRMLGELEKLSSPGQRLFVGPADLRRTNNCDTFIYHMMPQLQPATYFLEMNPLSANRPQSRLAADVESADWVVLNRQWNAWQEPNKSAEFLSDAPNAIVRRQFELCDAFGPYLLYRKRQR